MLLGDCIASEEVESRPLGDNRAISMGVVCVRVGIGTIEVWIPSADEPTVTILCHDSGRADAVPLIGHDLDNVGLGDSRVAIDSILPLIEK